MLGLISALTLFSCGKETASETTAIQSGSNQEIAAQENGINQKSSQPNILMIVLDTTRQDALGAYGNTLPTSPYFDKLATEGTLYTNAWAPASWTWPSHASMFTGLYPWEHGAHFTDTENGAVKLDPDPLLASVYVEGTKTLAMELNDLGYETISISANRLISPDFSLIGGFSHAEFQKDDSEVWNSVRQVLSKKRDKPLFLFVNLMSAHTPWFKNDVPWIKKYANELDPQSSPPWLQEYLLPDGIGVHPYLPHKDSNMIFRHISGKETLTKPQLDFLKALYLGEVSRADHYLGLITTAWKKQNPSPKIIVTSDHGEFFGEHQLLEHGRTLQPEVLRVPLLVVGDDKTGKNENVVSTKDVFCKTLDLAGSSQKKCGLDSQNEEVYAGSWVDVYWAKELGERFTKGYRSSMSKDNFLLVDSNNDCLITDFKTGKASKCLRHNLQSLFNGKTGKRAQADEKALKALQKLGYIGQDQ